MRETHRARGWVVAACAALALVPAASRAEVNGFTSFQLTQNDLPDTNLVAGGRFLAWLVDVGGGNARVGYAELLTGIISTSIGDNTPKKDLAFSQDGGSLAAWADGSGTSTDIFAYDAETGQQYRVTNNQQNNQKPKVAGGYIAWLGSDGANLQVWYADPRGGPGSGTQISTGASDKNNPFIGNAAGVHAIFWEEAGGINYWEDAGETPAVHAARIPAPGCADTIGNVAGGKAAFVEDCLGVRKVLVFDAGADLAAITDDTVTEASDVLQTQGYTPDTDGESVVWREGTGAAAEVWGCAIATCLSDRRQITNNVTEDDDPRVAAGIATWHQTAAVGDKDIRAYHFGSGATDAVTADGDADAGARVGAIGPDGVVWGGWLRTPNDQGDQEIYVLVPKISTPAGTNVVISPGNETTITYPTVSAAGDTTFVVKSLYSAPSVPLTGFQLGTIPTYFELATTAAWSGAADICIKYNQNFNDDETLLQVLHNEGGVWVDRTTSIDTAVNLICASVTSFSEVAFAVRDPTIIESVDPGAGPTAFATDVTIRGSGFLTGPTLHLIGPSGDVVLQNVQYVDANTLTARVPAHLRKGAYDLSLENRYGAGAFLSQGFTIDPKLAREKNGNRSSRGRR